MQKLEKDVRRGIENKFIKYVGELVYTMREKRHIRQEDLADCVGVSRASLSSYENAENPLPIKLLPLISLYCDFPMKRFTEWEEEKNIKKAFAKCIEVTAARYKRQVLSSTAGTADRMIVARIYSVGDMEWEERIPLKPQKRTPSMRELIRGGEYTVELEPLSDDEFVDYVKTIGMAEQLSVTLDFIRTCEPKRALLESVVSAVVDRVIVEPLLVYKDDTLVQRAYAYYKKMLDAKKTTSE